MQRVITVLMSGDPLRQVHVQFALGALNSEGSAGNRDGYTGRERDGIISNTRHLDLPDVAEDLAAHAAPARLAGHGLQPAQRPI